MNMEGCRQGCSELCRGCGILCSHAQRFSCADCTRRTFTINNLKQRLPILSWLPKYTLQNLYCDAIAGLTVGLTVIPQSLALAGLAELPPQYGLYSAFMGCFVYCFLGSAKDITLGPTAIMSLLTAEFAKSPIHGDATIAVVLTFFCGIIQLLMGMFKLGFLVDFISHPVITGFTSAAAITIAFSQVKTWWGIETSISRSFLPRVYQTIKYGIVKKETKLGDLFLGIGIMILLYIMKRMKNIQWRDHDVSAPVAVFRKTLWILGTARNALVVLLTAVTAGILHAHDLQPFTLSNNTQAGLPPFHFPHFSRNICAAANNSILLPPEDEYIMDSHSTCEYDTKTTFSTIGLGFAIIPLLGIVETIAIAKAFARKNNYKIDPTQEFIAMGVANIMSCFVQAYPVTGSFSRTAVNSQSGVRTPAGGLFTGALVLLALGVLTPYFFYIPSAALACVIIMAVVDMVDFGIICKFIRIYPLDIIPWLITFILSFVLGIEYGILLGVVISILMLMYPWARPTVHVPKLETLTQAGTDGVNDMLTRQLQATVIQLNQGTYYPGVEYITRRVMEEATADGSPKCVIMDMTHAAGIDYTAIQGFQALSMDCELQGITVVFCNVQPAVMKVILKCDSKSLLHYPTIDEAIEALEDQGCLREDNQRQGLLSGNGHRSYASPREATGSNSSVNHAESPPSASGGSHHSIDKLNNDSAIRVEDDEDDYETSSLKQPV